MGVEFSSEGLIHDFLLDLWPIWTTRELSISSQLESLRRSLGIDHNIFLRFSFKLFTLKVVFSSRIDDLVNCKGGRIKIAHKPIGLIGSIETDLICFHYIIKEAPFNLWFKVLKRVNDLVNLILFFFYMQGRIDWTTGGLEYYDVDPPKEEPA